MALARDVHVQSDSEAGGDADYESDSEGASALPLRRREASDDEHDPEHPKGTTLKGGFSVHDDAESQNSYSDADTDDAGAPPVEHYESEEVDDEAGNERCLLGRQRASDEEDEEGYDVDDEDLEGDEVDMVDNAVKDTGHTPGSKPKDVVTEDGGAKKDAEPFVVPTAGAFYMHDDRFRESGGVRPRRSMGGRRLWEAKDEKRWLHDMFEELTVSEEGFMIGRGRHRGRGRGRDRERGRGQGRGRGRGRIGKMNAFDDNRLFRPSHQNERSRGFQRETAKGHKADESSEMHVSSDAKGSTTHEVIQKGYSPPMSQTETAVAKRMSRNSVLNSSSPPFFPSGSYRPVVGKGSTSSGLTSSLDIVKGMESSSVKLATTSGLALVPTSSLHTGRVSFLPDVSTTLQKSHGGGGSYERMESKLHFSAPQTPSKLSVSSVNATESQSFQGRVQAVNLPYASAASQPLMSAVAPPVGREHISIQVNSIGRPQEQAVVQPSCENQVQASREALHGPSSVSISGSVATQQSSNSRSSTGAGTTGGRGMPPPGTSYLYNGVGQGAISSAVITGDQAYAPRQAVTPVTVQYTGQTQGGLGVSAVGVALPNFGGQPPYGFGSSEITWVPVLAGGGALGFGSPYVAMEGAPPTIYYTQPSIQSSTFKTPGGDINPSRTILGPWKPPQVSEPPGREEFEQRQNKPRRYSEMNFGH